MDKKNNDFRKRLLATFRIEAEEHARGISSGLIELEKAPVDKQMEIIEIVFREAHSLKGAARAVNITEIETICQCLESVFSALKRKESTLSPELFDVLHQTVDILNNFYLPAGAEQAAAEKSLVRDIVQRVEGALKVFSRPAAREEVRRIKEVPPPVFPPEAGDPATEEMPTPAGTVRISTAKLDSVFLQAEELLSVKLAAGRQAAGLREINSTFALWKREWEKIHHDVRGIQRSLERGGKQGEENCPPEEQRKKNRQMTRILEFMEWNSDFVKLLEGNLAALSRTIGRDCRSLGRTVENLLEDMKKILVLPCSSLLGVFPSLVRHLSRDQGKDTRLVIRGGDIEIDKRILEEMKDPLLHLVRNCIDHGIEKPEERVQEKKPPRGTITISFARKNSSKVEILISDDGRGIDVAKVKSAAVKTGVASKEEADRLSEREALALIFQSGVSTAPIVTDISGRGLGLSIVREKAEKLGGAVSLETGTGAGTTFRILLPMSLATFRGVLVRVEDRLFILPTASVERVMRVSKEGIKTVENRETIQFNGQAVSLVRLGEVLEFARQGVAGNSENSVPVVVLGSTEYRIAFLVDEVLGEQEVLVKSPGRPLSRLRNIAGATILETGRVAPILNIPDLMKSAVKSAPVSGKAGAAGEEDKVVMKSILIAEDSITARALLKNILEVSGYSVKTAVDGVDALTALRSGDFDLLVSDVDMPGMDGFELTAKIRADKKFSGLPVVLVTALESREDRERGIDAGANAYIVKSSFDQSNLLEVIRRLI